MKNFKLFIGLLFSLILLVTACNNASDDTSKTGKDTTSTKDTTRSDPSNFSEPH